jgi:drug/metabolite transporter, DME family
VVGELPTDPIVETPWVSTNEGLRPGPLWRGLVLVSLAGIIWGTIGPGAQVLHDRSGLSSLTVTAYRAMAAVAVLGVAVVLSRRQRQLRAAAVGEWRRVGAIGVLTATYQFLFFVAVVFTGVSIATVVSLGFPPVLLLLLGSLHARRWPRGAQAATVLIAVVGLLLVAFAGQTDQGAPHPLLGILAALASGAAYAVATDIAAPLSLRLDTLTITAATIAVAALVLVPTAVAVTALRGDAFTTSDPASWALIAYLGVFTLALAYALLFTGLRSAPSSAAVIATLLEPVTAVLIAVALLGERLTAAGVLGSLLIVAAIASLGRSQRPAPQ